MNYYIGLRDRTGKIDVSSIVKQHVKSYAEVIGFYTNEDGTSYKENSIVVSGLPLSTIKQILRDSNQECVLGVDDNNDCYFIDADGNYCTIHSFNSVGKLVTTDKQPVGLDYTYDGSFFYYISDKE